MTSPSEPLLRDFKAWMATQQSLQFDGALPDYIVAYARQCAQFAWDAALDGGLSSGTDETKESK